MSRRESESPSPEEIGIKPEQKEEVRKINVDLYPFGMHNTPVKIIDGKVIEFLEDYENDESSSYWRKDDDEEWRKLGLNIQFRSASGDWNDGYVLIQKDELNRLISEGLIEINIGPQEDDSSEYYKVIIKGKE